ncbi:MAG: TonB-dependent receptor [Marinifilaceae bacterium]
MTILFLTMSLLAVAQQKGTLSGIVFDGQSRDKLPGATVVLRGTDRGVVTDVDGKFSIEGITPGYVQLEVRMVGYRTLVTEHHYITAFGVKHVEITMEEQSTELAEAVVTATPSRKQVTAPMSIQRIDLGVIEQMPGGNRDISRVVQSMPGVLSSPAFRNDLIVRGGGPGENSFYIDGIHIPVLNHFSTQGTAGGVVSIVNVDFLKDVSLLTGTFPAQYGEALSSVLDFKFVNGNPYKIKGRATVGATDYGLSCDGPIGENVSYIFSVRRSYLKMLFGILELPFLPVYNDMQFKLRFQLSEKSDISVIGLGALDYNRLNRDIASPTADQRYMLGYLPENDQWLYTLGLSYNYYSNGGRHQATMSRSSMYNHIFKDRDNIEELGRVMNIVSREDQNRVTYQFSRTILGGFLMNVGANGVWYDYRNCSFRERFNGEEKVDERYHARLSFPAVGVYGQLSRRFLAERLLVNVGLRAEWADYNVETRKIGNQLSPRFSASYSATSAVRFNVAAGRYVQLPSLTTLGYARDGQQFNRDNGVNFIAMKQYGAGVEVTPGKRISLTLEGFYKQYDRYPVSLIDTISLANKGGDYMGISGDEPVSSVGEGRSYGAELTVKGQPIKGMTLLTAYTWYKSEFCSNIGGFNSYIPANWDNRHLLSVIVNQRLWGDWNIGAKWRYIGGAPYTPFDIETSSIIDAWDAKQQPYLDYAQYNEGRLKPFHQLDVRIEKAFHFKRWSLVAYFDMQNVYNKGSYGDPLLQPVLSAEGNKIVDVNNPSRYVMEQTENKIGGTRLPTMGIMIDF